MAIEPNLTGTALQAALAKIKAMPAPVEQQKILDAEQLAKASEIKLPQAAQNAFTGLGVGIPASEAPKEKSIQELYMDSIKDITPVNEGDIRTQLESAAKIAEQEKITRGLKEQIDLNTAEAQAAQLAQGERLTSMGAISGAQADIERKLAIRNLPLTAQYQAASGNLQAAQDTVTKLFEAKVADAKNQNEYKLGLINAAYNVATAAEKKLLDAKAVEEANKFAIEKDKLNFEQQKELAKYTNDLKIAEDKANLIPGAAVTLTGKPQNAAQSSANGYADRLNSSNIIIDSIGGNFTGKFDFGGSLPNALQSAERQSYEQAKRNFITAVLRRESGAAISPSEFDTEALKYFPQAGDKPETVVQKSNARNIAINNIYREANVARPVLPGQIIESGGKKYRVASDGETLEQI